MSHVFLHRRFESPVSPAMLEEDAASSWTCFDLHKVRWEESLLATDGRELLCHFSAPDAESVRIALRQLDADMRVHWSGSVHDAPGVGEEDLPAANVVVHRIFDVPVELPDLQAVEDAFAHCLEAHRVRFLRTFFSLDRLRMACLYSAPDAESVRIAQRQAGMPVESVVAVQRLAPDR